MLIITEYDLDNILKRSAGGSEAVKNCTRFRIEFNNKGELLLIPPEDVREQIIHKCNNVEEPDTEAEVLRVHDFKPHTGIYGRVRPHHTSFSKKHTYMGREDINE